MQTAVKAILHPKRSRTAHTQEALSIVSTITDPNIDSEALQAVDPSLVVGPE